MPSIVVTSNASEAALEMTTSVRLIVDAFASTTSNVTVASVPSPSDDGTPMLVPPTVTLLPSSAGFISGKNVPAAGSP